MVLQVTVSGPTWILVTTEPNLNSLQKNSMYSSSLSHLSSTPLGTLKVNDWREPKQSLVVKARYIKYPTICELLQENNNNKNVMVVHSYNPSTEEKEIWLKQLISFSIWIASGTYENLINNNVLLFLKTGFCFVSSDDFQRTMQPKMASNSWQTSCLSLLSAGIRCMNDDTQFILTVL